MRIACVHVPQFALQCLTRIDPSLRGAAVAVVGAGFEPGAGVRPSLALHSPLVLACSRAARTLGVRIGMTATAARFVSPELHVVAADGQLERETVRAIADVLLAASPVVDAGGRVSAGGAHLAMYCEVPTRMRGATFGDRLLALLDTLGLAARIGIADDRFTAWVAAAHGGAEGGARDREAAAGGRDGAPTAAGRDGAQAAAGRDGAPTAGGRDGAQAAVRSERGVVVVPRGGSAGFLAPRPLSLLAITPEVQHMLEALGVRTLGAFAALPAPSVARPLEADFQALARGESGYTLRPYAPEAPIREELVVGHTASLFGGVDAATALAERVASRLAGRARGAARLEIAIAGGEERVEAVAAEPAARTLDALVALIAPRVREAGASTRLRVVVASEALADGDVEIAARSGAGAGADAGAGAGADADADADADLGQVVALAQGQPWQLSVPLVRRAEDRHRRTRRAKRGRPLTLAQPQLFGNGVGNVVGNVDRS